MRSLQRLRGSTYALSAVSTSKAASHSLAPSTCRLHREFHAAVARRCTSSAQHLPGTNESAWRPAQHRSFSNSTQQRKEKEVLTGGATGEASSSSHLTGSHENFVDLEELQDPEEFQIETDLPIPRGFTTAPPPKDVTDPEYEPAQTAEGLETVGGWAGFWEQPNAWPISKSYFGFRPHETVTNRNVLAVITRRALVEALAVRQVVGREALVESWRLGGLSESSGSSLAAALDIKIQVAEDGSAQLTGAVDTIARTVCADEPSVWEENISAEDAQNLVKSWDDSWKQVSLRDQGLKFAVLKRIQQLSGQVVADAQQINIDKVASLLAQIIKAPKPKKLVEEIQRRGELSSLPNVNVYSRRVTPIDKEKMVGRWKVITKELEKRGLPVIGDGGFSKTPERKWATGDA